MTPYYQREGVTLYLGDCRELLSAHPTQIDALVTDPPYGVGAVRRGRVHQNSKARYIPILGDDRPFNPSHLLGVAPRTVLFGANHYSHHLPASACWLIWDKRRGARSNHLADCEMAWTNLSGPARLFPHRWMGFCRDSERGEHYHPTQKPVALMRWALRQLNLSPGAVVVDPYLGAGSTAIACRLDGYQFIGCDLAEPYLEITARRLDMHDDG